MATACFRLLTFLPLPDFSVPLLCSVWLFWVAPIVSAAVAGVTYPALAGEPAIVNNKSCRRLEQQRGLPTERGKMVCYT